MDKQKNINKNKQTDKNKVDLGYNLEIERTDSRNLKKKGYDFVPRIHHWVSVDEQKIKVEEIEKKTE